VAEHEEVIMYRHDTSDSYSELVGQCSEPGLAVERVSLTVFICQLAGEPVIMMDGFLAGCVLLLPLANVVVALKALM